MQADHQFLAVDYTLVCGHFNTIVGVGNEAVGIGNLLLGDQLASPRGVGAPCRICLERPTSIVLQPCRHVGLCDACSVRMTRCPFCNATVSDKQRVYYP